MPFAMVSSLRNFLSPEDSDVKEAKQRGKKKGRPRPAKAPDASIASQGNGAPFFVVGIGASAGGLEALGTFFDAMPNDSGMAFVVIQHLSPNHKSMMVTLLARKTGMPVSQATEGITVKPNHVYLIPPRKSLTISDGHLLLTERDSKSGLNLPVDRFLTSLALDCGDRAVAIALSGTGSDGTRGIRSIKEAGGLVMIQDEDSAKFSGMPHSAIATGLADYVLPAGKMAAALIKFVKHPHFVPSSSAGADPPATIMEKIESLLRMQTGIDFSGYKQSTVVRRLERRIGISRLQNSEQYLEYLRQSPQEIAAFSKDLLISVTRFFRDREAFKVLGREIVPAIFANGGPIRVWVPGCATGEEAYSLAILLQEQAATLGEKYDVKIFATDASKESVHFAGLGIYPVSIAADVPADLLARHFVKTEEGYRISRGIRDHVVFAPHNILRDPPFTRMDLVSCRNVLIYLQAPAQRKVLSLFHFALRPAGYLFLGPSETVGEHQNAFDSVNSKARIFQKQSAATTATSEMIPTGATFAPIRERTPRDISSRNGGLRAQVKLREAIHSKLISRFAPTCFAVDERNEILYSFGKPQAFISLGTGQANLNLLKLAPRDLSLAIATALRKSRKENAVVRYQGIKVRHDQATNLVDLKAEPVSLGGNAPAVTFIFLEEAERPQTPSPSEGDEFDQSKRSTERIGELEEDIEALREDLRRSVEQRETSAEELQATNEELIASNEELQSSNEELESINEELTTLNSEYLLKNDELLTVNNDIDNFFRTSQIGTILLDESLRIRRFTPLVAAEMNLRPQDAGRALRDLSHVLIGDLTREAERVLREGAPVEKTVETKPGVWYLLRISPYQREGASDLGIVVTFVNVSVLKQGP